MCSKALTLIRMVVVDSRRTKSSAEVLAELDLSVLVLVSHSESDVMQEKKDERSMDSQTRLIELVQLLQEMVRTPGLRINVMQAFTEHTMRKILSPMLDRDEAPAGGDWPGNLFQVGYYGVEEYRPY